MKCNCCWKDIDPSEYYVVNKCKHIFCSYCAQKAWLNGNYKCPLCQITLTEDDISRNDSTDFESIAQQLYGISPKNLNEVICLISNFNQKQQLLYESKLQHDNHVNEKKLNGKYQQVISKAFDYRKQRDQIKNELEKYKKENEKLELENQQFKALIQEYEQNSKQTKDIILRMQQEQSEKNSIISSKLFSPQTNQMKQLFKQNTFEVNPNTALQKKLNMKMNDKFAQLKKIREENKKEINLKPTSKKNTFSLEKKRIPILQSPVVNRPMFTSPLKSVVIPFTPI
ncbi:hypothetical protein, conserved [Entamoeba dispar SAW760]|uniref:RING-type domain-containing protein n=1 Tax=Entamoeba dispar (strain ATCC PRA-260 / SAW760) TaxID=370354 RepID=B0ESM8_ENTDS|nr:uncharacterized protein EDI_039330 [Entamoeba dispar SAW760]EDR22455.1 hypothetical protein, conserved [Entamoeba dispar SAW760]|eukprot:EDR22455.1 hypothetical protein, conserved [Entamoeba dispar SAW760]